MASGKMSPRQKMINMMYLVLIAMLALNVSKEIIKAFNLFENSLISSTKNLVDKNKIINRALDKQVAQDNKQAELAQKFVNKVTGIANKFNGMLTQYGDEIVIRAGGRGTEPENILVKDGVPELSKGDDIEGHARFLLVELNGKEVGQEAKVNNGTQLQAAINQARKDMLSVMEEAIKAGLSPTVLRSKLEGMKNKTSLRADDQMTTDGSKLEWYKMYLVETPAASVMAMLAKLKNDARTLESEINGELASAVGAEDFKFDALEAIVSAPTSAILRGETYEADIILAAYDSKANMNISVNGRPLKIEGGKGKFTASGGSAGEFSYKVKIAVPNPAGGSKVIEGEGKYSVFEPAASISADALNMIYIGLDNPMSITVAGVDPKNVSVSASGVSLRQTGGGKYKALASNPGNATIRVSANIKGRTVSMGDKVFKVRPVPNPVFKAGAVKFDQPTVSLSALNYQPTANAILENFIYDGVSFKVVSYTFTCVGQRTNGPQDQKVSSSSLIPIRPFLQKLRAGDFVSFTGIKVVGPDGRVRPIQNASARLAK